MPSLNAGNDHAGTPCNPFLVLLENTWCYFCRRRLLCPAVSLYHMELVRMYFFLSIPKSQHGFDEEDTIFLHIEMSTCGKGPTLIMLDIE